MQPPKPDYPTLNPLSQAPFSVFRAGESLAGSGSAVWISRAAGDKERQITKEVMQHFEKSVMLQVLDNSWKEHLAAMDYLRQGIHFRGYAQKDPKQEYKREAFEMFTHLLDHIKYEVIGILFKVQVRQEEDVKAIDEQRQAPKEMHFEHAEAPSLDEQEQPQVEPGQEEQVAQPFVRYGNKIGRNDPCPCGSGKKYSKRSLKDVLEVVGTK